MSAAPEALAALIEGELQCFLAARREATPARLHDAMAWALLGGGKRLRPVLALAACEAAGGEPASRPARDFAVAIEAIHTYSLVHDDLPAMDDDDLRRGRPTVHRRFDEATAILAGDALLTEAFVALADGPEPVRLALVGRLARAAGAAGMVGGQQLDLDQEGRLSSGAPLPALAEIEALHRKKTGALLAVAVEGGAIAAGADPALLQRFARFGAALGLAFQIADDLLDVEGDPAAMGKAGGGDAQKGKPTYPALLGLEAARRKADEARDAALAALDGLGPAAETLRQLAHSSVNRRR